MGANAAAAPPTVTKYLYDGDNVLADFGNDDALTAFYVTPGLDQNLSVTDASGQTAYYTQDGLGSVRTITSANGAILNRYDYTAFGEPFDINIAITVSSRYTYTSREQSPLAAHGAPMYYRWRNYAPELGRFMWRDPIGYAGGVNVYGYVVGNPIRYLDPNGTDAASKQWIINNIWTVPTGDLNQCFHVSEFKRKLVDFATARDDNHFYVAEKLPHSIKDRILGIDGPGAYGTTFNQVWVKLSADAITYAHEVLHFYDDWYDLTPWYSQDAAEKLTYSMEKIVEIANNVKNILDYHINADADELPRSWNQGLRIGYLNLHDNKVATAQSDDTELVFFEILKKHFGLRVSCGCLLEYVKSKSSNPNIQCLNCEGLPDVLK